MNSIRPFLLERKWSLRSLCSARAGLPLLLLLVLCLGAAGCASKKPKPKYTPKCMRYDRAQGTTVSVECSAKDQDEDGIDDAADLCPNAAESKNGVDDEDGCPDPDMDGDLVEDEVDDCPRLAGPAPTGCPPIDADADGFADHLDSCPDSAEDFNGVDDGDGCPDGMDVLVVARKDSIFIKQPIHFLRRSAMLLPDSKNLLDRVAVQLKGQERRISRIRVVGHTDRKEVPRRKAHRLSRTRARIVARYLVFQGLDKSKFEIRALGAKQPSAKGRRKRDLEKNRRVELLVTLLQAEKADPTPPPAAADAAPASSADAGSPSPDAAVVAASDAGGATADSAPAQTDVASPAQKDQQEGVEPYDEKENWDDEFMEDDWDKVFLQKEKET